MFPEIKDLFQISSPKKSHAIQPIEILKRLDSDMEFYLFNCSFINC